MTLPVPIPGLVINYSYLWWSEDRAGLDEGVKDRPCVIAAMRSLETRLLVATVLPITHAVPKQSDEAVEMPPQLKAHLGLDGERSYVVVTEANDFIWPGPDLRPVSRGKSGLFHFGVLPPRFFAHIRDLLLKMHSEARLKRVSRTS
ncbi:hypothetical protein [Mesorhizobium australicum]|uniref:PemK-like, MazF-like toxin of type II toxin-antitoxin system n=1 Tax=Mesorhizobium australicum TaxID=536018 RepID=A0A1X7NL82_9HYPH|nr:hypothetical protein [Mesorhizobium australicum]SMH38622.1 hypothetical protein SAMN02982922_2071 [Mesorhizobium australicum]